MSSQSLLSGANQLQDITNDPDYSDLVGLSWDQIQAAFPTRLQQLADETYEAVQRSKADEDVMEPSGVAHEAPKVVSSLPEERLQRLHLIMNDRCGCATLSFAIAQLFFHSHFGSLTASRVLLYSSSHLQIQRLSIFAQIACLVFVLLVRGGADSESA